MEEKQEDPKLKKIVDAADGLSLGISMVVAVLIGVGIGLGLRNLTGCMVDALDWSVHWYWCSCFKCL